MAYQIKASDPDLGAALRRIADNQLRGAIAATRNQEDPEVGIHEARKHCKKLRGLLRLVRTGFRDHAEENAAIRDAARLSSTLRDTTVLLETHDALMAAPGVARADFAQVRGALTRARDEAFHADDVPGTLADQRAALEAILERSADWKVKGKAADVIGEGVATGWKRAAGTMPDRPGGTDPEKIHEWRKRAKDHWYQARLLRGIWPGPMKVHAAQCDRLTGLLGDHHDLAVYEEFLDSNRAPGIEAERMIELRRIVSTRQDALEREAWSLGARLFAPPLKSLPKRWQRHWTLWRKGV